APAPPRCLAFRCAACAISSATTPLTALRCRRRAHANSAAHLHLVASPASTMTVSTSPAPARRKAAASSYSFDVKQATPCSRVGNSIDTKRGNLAGPPMIGNRPPRARTLPPYLAMIAGTRSVYFLYSTGSLIFERATQYAGIVLFLLLLTSS